MSTDTKSGADSKAKKKPSAAPKPKGPKKATAEQLLEMFTHIQTHGKALVRIEAGGYYFERLYPADKALLDIVSNTIHYKK